MRALLAVVLVAVACTAASAAPAPGFELPYDLVVARDGTIYVADRSRILRVQPRSGVVRVHRRIDGASELVALTRLPDGTFLAADLPSGRVFRFRAKGAVTTVATVSMPVDLLVDAARG